MAISPEYQQLIRELHEREDSFGGGRHVPVVAQLMRKFNVGTLSDYGEDTGDPNDLLCAYLSLICVVTLLNYI